MAKTIDLRTYLLLERAFVRRLQRSWKKQSAPTYAAIAQACTDHEWDHARRLVSDLDMTEVGTENREWITYMLLSCAVFGAGTVAKGKPSFVGTGTFDTLLKQVTNNMLQHFEHGATAQIQTDALHLIAEDEAQTKAIKWEETQHPRDKSGKFSDKAGITPEEQQKLLRGEDTLEGGGPIRAEWVKRNHAVMEADDAVWEAHRILHTVESGLKEGTDFWSDEGYVKAQRALQRAKQILGENEGSLKAIEPAMRKEVVGNLSRSVAMSMGIDPSIIHVVDKEASTFAVGSKQFREGGHFSPSTGEIEINSRNLDYGDAAAVRGIAAHEISHAIHHKIKKAAQKEFERYLDLALNPGGQSHTDWYRERFEMVGDVRREMRLKPEYREEFAREYPASAAMAELGGDFFKGISKEMVAENGHSAYAKSYWDKDAIAARGFGASGYGSAINETIAEITRYIISPRSWHEDKTPDMESPWTKMTVAMHEWFRQQQKAHA